MRERERHLSYTTLRALDPMKVLVASATPVTVAPGVYVVMGLPREIAPANLGRVVNVAFVIGPRESSSAIAGRHTATVRSESCLDAL